jgi:phosphate transport system substrate-binding protein
MGTGTVFARYALLFMAYICLVPASQARDRIWIVGSSTVSPFATAVAETFEEYSPHPMPRIENTGSIKGFELFCSGVGEAFPDIVNASTRITEAEMERCRENGASEIVEIKIGYDGIGIANAKKAPFFHLTLRQLYLALAKEVPYGGHVVPNPYTRWMQINPTLPLLEIRVIGPSATSGTRSSFIELALERGCQTFPELNALKTRDAERYQQVCRKIRSDGVYIEAGEDDEAIVRRLHDDPSMLGIFGFNFLDRNPDWIKAARIQGELPSFETISWGQYPLTRTLYFYVKKAQVHDVPGLSEYLREFTNEWTWGPDGYLVEKGLIPLAKEERRYYYGVARRLGSAR